MRGRILPWALEELELGHDVLELGPGAGAATDLLRTRVRRLTCVELDRDLAARLRARLSGANVTVLCENATATSLPGASFDAVVCFSMLHHVPAPAAQDRLLAEAARVLRPGGLFAGFDVVAGRLTRLIHLCDTFVAIDPAGFGKRLTAAGFGNAVIEPGSAGFRFHARRV